MEATRRTRGGGSRLAAAAVAALAAVLALAGCGGGATGDGPEAGATPSATTGSVEASAPPSPTSTLTPEEQQAFEEATATALAYRQTIADLYSGARTNLNDLDQVATGDLLDRGLRNIQQGLDQGYRSDPQGVRLVLVSAEPVSVDLEGSPATVVVRACIDATALTDVGPDGSEAPGLREELVYTALMTNYLAAPGWAVAEVKGERDAADRQC